MADISFDIKSKYLSNSINYFVNQITDKIQEKIDKKEQKRLERERKEQLKVKIKSKKNNIINDENISPALFKESASIDWLFVNKAIVILITNKNRFPIIPKILAFFISSYFFMLNLF